MSLVLHESLKILVDFKYSKKITHKVSTKLYNYMDEKVTF